jgi:hypothetical protein
MVVPISYGPYQKFLARITQDPRLDNKSAITLPRMSFEMLSMSYDGQRKIGSINKLRPSTATTSGTGNLLYAPAPYNIEFNLYIMTKHAEDATKIVEQIIPFFKPEYTVSAKLIDDLPPFDIPIILNGVNIEDIYEADFDTRRSIMWTLSFTMKCFYFGPVRNKKVIKFVDSRIHGSMNSDLNPVSIVTSRPGLTEDGSPTTNINETIPYEEINIDDDWGVITLVEDYNEPD